MTFSQELLGLFGINLKLFFKIKIFADFVVFVHTSTSGNAKKRAAENFAAPQLPTISITFRVMIMGREASRIGEGS